MVSYGGAGDTNAAKLGLAAEPFPIEMMNNVTLALTAGFIIGARVRPISSLITKLGLLLGAAGVTPNGVNGMALLDSQGNLIDQTGDLSTAWSTAGNNGLAVTGALSLGAATVSTSSDYYVCALSHMATPPQIGGFFAGGGVAYPALSGIKAVLADGGHAAFPSQLNLTTAAGGNAGYWLFGS